MRNITDGKSLLTRCSISRKFKYDFETANFHTPTKAQCLSIKLTSRMSFTVTTYWRKMDPQPLLKKDFSNAVILPTFKTSFQETLRQPTCSKDVEEYILRNEVDEELKLKQNAIHILEVSFKCFF